MAHSICPLASGLVHFLSQCVPDFCSSLCPHAALAMAAAATRPTRTPRPGAFLQSIKDRRRAGLNVRSTTTPLGFAWLIALAHFLANPSLAVPQAVPQAVPLAVPWRPHISPSPVLPLARCLSEAPYLPALGPCPNPLPNLLPPSGLRQRPIRHLRLAGAKLAVCH